MRWNSRIMGLWNDPGFQPIGENRSNCVVTVEPDWYLTTENTGLGAWPAKKKPVRWFQSAVDPRNEIVVPNVRSVTWDRGIDKDAGECVITLTNQWMKTNYAAGVARELGTPGYFTFNHGESAEGRARWLSEENEWRGILVPGALIRVREGYGGHHLPWDEAEAEGYIMLTGTWMVDDITIGARSRLIEIRCRDMGALLIDQVLYPPLVPSGMYPLRYSRWVQQTNAKKSYTVTQTVTKTEVVAQAGATVKVSFADSSNDRWYPTWSPGAYIPEGGYLLHGHRGSHSLDGKFDSYWLSIGNSHPSRPWCTDWIEYNAGGQYVQTIEVTPWRGPYTMFVSIMEDGRWIGSSRVPYVFSEMNGPGNYAVNTGADIPYVKKLGVNPDKANRVTLDRAYRAQRIRISFRDHVNSGIGQWVYRCGVREFKAFGSMKPVTKTTTSKITIHPVWKAGSYIRSSTKPDAAGYLLGSHSGKFEAFGDARVLGGATGDAPSNAEVNSVVFNSDATGYWVLRGDGSVTAYGNAVFYGSPKQDGLSRVGGFSDPKEQPWKVLLPTPSGDGYWAVSSGGWVLSFGDAAPFSWLSPSSPIVSGAALINDQGFVVVERSGQVHARGSASTFGNWSGGLGSRTVTDIAVTQDGDGYWLLRNDGQVQAKGAATLHGTAGSDAAAGGRTFHLILPNLSGSGFILVRDDGALFPFGAIDMFGSPITAVTLRADGNYKDLADITKDLLLWSGFWLKDTVPAGENPQVHGFIETTGIYSPEALPPDLFDKKPPIDPIKMLRELVGYMSFVDYDGGFVWRSPNWWAAGNFLDTGERTSYIPEIDEQVQLTDYTARVGRDKDRSELIITTDEPTAGFRDTVTTRFTPSNSFLRGMIRPAMIRLPPEITAAEQRVMAELIALHLWFARRTGNVTMLGNPCIGPDDQVRIWERVTGESYINYVRSVASSHDVEKGVWTMQLTTNWLGTENGTWAIRAADIDKSGGLVAQLQATQSQDQFILSSALSQYVENRSRLLALNEPPVMYTPDLDEDPGEPGAGPPVF